MQPIRLDTIEREVWRWLAAAASEPGNPFRTPVLATTDQFGNPSARIVVLRAADEGAWTLEFHTDVRAPKVTQLRQRDAVSWCFYDPVASIQVRAEATASLHVGDAIADASWAAAGLGSRSLYMSAERSGQEIDSPAGAVFLRDESHSLVGRQNFCVARCRVSVFDVLQLHPDGHRRASVEPGRCAWLAP